MKIQCHKCQNAVGTLADEKIPLDTRCYVTCPHCREKISIFRKGTAPPLDETGEKGPAEADRVLPPFSGHIETPSSSPTLAEQPRSTTYVPEFSGTAGEYFRIWIVNTFLTIFTLGIYAAWAKVRTRRYFYANTKLAGHSFDYLANPKAILVGNAIVGTGFIIYLISDFLHPAFKIGIIAITALLLPLLIYKSIRFYARNSAFRNIRFNFLGTLKEGYSTYLLIPLLIPLTMGLITPYWVYRRKRYFFDNIAFGRTASAFSGKAGSFYRIHGTAAALIILAFGAVFLSAQGTELLSTMTQAGAGDKPGSLDLGKTIFIGFVVAYIAFLLFFTVIQQYIFVRLTNYCWRHAQLGKVLFNSTIKVRKLVWIKITNLLAIIFSLGLMAPWAKIRNARYILGNLAVTVSCSLDEFTAGTGTDENAVGDAATDFFDFEIGL